MALIVKWHYILLFLLFLNQFRFQGSFAVLVLQPLVTQGTFAFSSSYILVFFSVLFKGIKLLTNWFSNCSCAKLLCPEPLTAMPVGRKKIQTDFLLSLKLTLGQMLLSTCIGTDIVRLLCRNFLKGQNRNQWEKKFKKKKKKAYLFIDHHYLKARCLYTGWWSWESHLCISFL